jgi:hypothetical protein
MTNNDRLRLFSITVAFSFLVGIFFAGQLFLGTHRSYPLIPLLPIFNATPSWIDLLLSGLLIISLIGIITSRKTRLFLFAGVAIAALLFLDDRQRLFPSFYEYFLLFIVLASYSWNNNDERAGKILNVCRLGIIFIYVWSGAQKITPLFEGQLAWVLAPLTNALPWLNGGFIQFASIIAPLIEIEIGIALLFKKTRQFGLIEALFMHLMLFFFIGPLRDPYHESAWLWNVASACMVVLLFFQANETTAKRILFDFSDLKTGSLRIFALIFFGLLPALNFVNLWDSSLSFNVFSGNVASAEIRMTSSTVENLPPEIQNYAISILPDNSIYDFNLNQWAEDEFSAGPIPEPSVFKAITASLCHYANQPSGIELTIHDKATILETPDNATIEQYTCADL